MHCLKYIILCLDLETIIIKNECWLKAKSFVDNIFTMLRYST